MGIMSKVIISIDICSLILKMICMKYLVVIIFLFFISCQSEKNIEIRDVSDVLVSDSLSTVKMEGEKLDLDLLCPLSILCVDTILLVYQDFEEKMIKAYGMQGGQLLGQFLRKGGGPDEVYMFSGFVQSLTQGNTSAVVIQSYPQYLALLDLNETLEENKTMYKKKYSFVDSERNALFAACNAVFYLKDNILLLTKAPERSGKMDDGNTYFELYDYDKNSILKCFYATDLPFIPQAFELYKGSLALKKDHTKIVSFMRFMPMFAITDIETGSSKQYFPFGKSNDLKEYIKVPGHYYWGACATDNHIIALYKGGIDPMKLESDTLTSFLHIFDWEGRLLHKIEIEDNIKCISFEEKTGVVYAVIMNDEIKKYNIRQYL